MILYQLSSTATPKNKKSSFSMSTFFVKLVSILVNTIIYLLFLFPLFCERKIRITEMVRQKLMSYMSAALKQWFLPCKCLQSQIVIDTLATPNHPFNISIVDLVCLICLLQSMEDCFRRSCNRIKCSKSCYI